MAFVVLGLGSNKAWRALPPLSVLAAACAELQFLLRGFRVSSVYRTKPMYVQNQSDFLNLVVGGDYNDLPQNLLDEVHRIESSLGRDRSKEIRNGSRTIDIDIELFGSGSVHVQNACDPMKNLEIPHPRLYERAFVLVPLLEILDKSADILNADMLLEKCGKIDSGGVRKMQDAKDFLSEIRTYQGRMYGTADELYSAQSHRY